LIKASETPRRPFVYSLTYMAGRDRFHYSSIIHLSRRVQVQVGVGTQKGGVSIHHGPTTVRPGLGSTPALREKSLGTTVYCIIPKMRGDRRTGRPHAMNVESVGSRCEEMVLQESQGVSLEVLLHPLGPLSSYHGVKEMVVSAAIAESRENVTRHKEPR
jgi:hypothetical protein